MVGIIVFILIVYVVVYTRNANKKRRSEAGRRGNAHNPMTKMAVREEEVKKRKTPQASAVPNQPRVKRTRRTPEAPDRQPASSGKTCTYDAAYSRGKPERVGLRGDYETSIPSGMEKVSCSYCGAENFVPAGNHEHYHCFFCWEKL